MYLSEVMVLLDSPLEKCDSCSFRKLIRNRNKTVKQPEFLLEVAEDTFKQQEEEHDNEVSLPNKFTNVDNIRVCLENLDDYLQRKRGISGVPLAAYTREDVDLPPDGEDPGCGTPSILKEMIRCAPHTGATYHAGNKAIWDAV